MQRSVDARAGFTLIEILVALMILSLLFAIVVPNLGALVPSARLHASGNKIQRELDWVRSEARIQGKRIKSKREIRVASVFKEVPPEFLRMVVVHELAHLREREHDRAFYQLCEHMEPAYHQFEFDLRLYLTQRELSSVSTA